MKLSPTRLGYVLVAVGFLVIAAGVTWDYQVHSLELAAGHVNHEEPAVGPTAHNLAIGGIGFVGLGISALGLRGLLQLNLTTRFGIAKFFALVLILTDGVIHLFAMNEHMTVVPFAAFFLVTGVGQLALPVVVMKRERLVLWAGIAVSLLLIAIFAYTRTFPAPFQTEPEPVETLGIISKVVEATTVALLAYVGSHKARK